MLSLWLESVSPTDRHGDFFFQSFNLFFSMLIFFNLFGSEQLVRCHTHIAGNRLDLVITDAPDILDVFVGTILGTFDHCFVSCVFQVEQSVTEYNVGSTVFLKHRTNWDNVLCLFCACSC